MGGAGLDGWIVVCGARTVCRVLLAGCWGLTSRSRQWKKRSRDEYMWTEESMATRQDKWETRWNNDAITPRPASHSPAISLYTAPASNLNLTYNQQTAGQSIWLDNIVETRHMSISHE